MKNWIFKKILGNLMSPKNSEFWTGPANILAQGCLKLVGWMVPETRLAEMSEGIREWLLLMLPYAAGRVISKAVKPE